MAPAECERFRSPLSTSRTFLGDAGHEDAGEEDLRVPEKAQTERFAAARPGIEAGP